MTRHDHYLFGDFRSTAGPLDAALVDEVFARAEQARARLAQVPYRDLIELLDRVGRRWASPDDPLRRLALEHMPGLVGFSPAMVERALDELARLLSRSTLLATVRYDLGLPDTLDRWVFRPGYRGYLRAQPLGVVLHVSPGNVFVGAVDSLVRGFLTKNVNLLKVSRADPLFPLLFAQSLAETDPDGMLSSTFAVLSFRGGETAVERMLKERCQGIVVWGGQEAVEAWRRDLPAGCRLVDYGPRLSFAVVTRLGLAQGDPAEMARRLATDVVMWEQRACSSPQVLFLEGEAGDEAVQTFLECLRLALDRLTGQLPPGERSLDEKIEILRERELTRFGELSGQERGLFREGDLSWTLLWREKAERLGSPLNRTLVIHPYQEWEQVLQALTPRRAELQTAAIGGTPREIRQLSAALTALGVTRITELGKMHLGKPGSPHDGSFELGRLVRWVAIESVAERFDVGERLDPPERVPLKKRRLRDLVEFARERSPFYRQRLGTHPFRGPEDLPGLPLLTGEDIRKHAPPQSQDMLTGPLEGAYIFASGGSTGAPKFSLLSYEEWEEITDLLAEIYQVAGLTAGDTVGNLFMAGRLWTSFLAVNQALEKVGCVTLPIAGNAELDLVLRYLEIFRPTALVGLPSILIQIAETCQRRHLDLRVPKILYGGEHLSPEARDYFRQVLGSEIVMSAGYASVDAGPIGYQCPQQQGGVHHLLYDYQYLEIVDPATGRPVEAGQVGEIVVTCIRRRLMPILRYRTGDLGQRVLESCPCGRDTPLFALRGRADDVVRVGSVSIYPDDIAAALAAVEGVSHLFQVVAERQGVKDRLIVRAELITSQDGAGRGEAVRQAILERSQELAEAVREGWLGELSVELLPPDSLPRVDRTGKIRRLVDLRQPG
jgi:phenylacetate-coenzyme A ligase PaaK-like adenylate-forming protein